MYFALHLQLVYRQRDRDQNVLCLQPLYVLPTGYPRSRARMYYAYNRYTLSPQAILGLTRMYYAYNRYT